MKTVISFGFKDNYIPAADEVIDARIFKNPHKDKKLRYLTGLDELVRNEVLGTDGVKQLIAEIVAHDSNTVAIGCFGGRHRSVAIAEEIGRLTGATVVHLSL